MNHKTAAKLNNRPIERDDNSLNYHGGQNKMSDLQKKSDGVDDLKHSPYALKQQRSH